LLTAHQIGVQINRPPKALHVFSNGELRMSDKLLINFFGLIISADGVCAIVAAVIIVLVIALRRAVRQFPSAGITEKAPVSGLDRAGAILCGERCSSSYGAPFNIKPSTLRSLELFNIDHHQK
jgi:hypothetical protein